MYPTVLQMGLYCYKQYLVLCFESDNSDSALTEVVQTTTLDRHSHQSAYIKHIQLFSETWVSIKNQVTLAMLLYKSCKFRSSILGVILHCWIRAEILSQNNAINFCTVASQRQRLNLQAKELHLVIGHDNSSQLWRVYQKSKVSGSFHIKYS